ncbi:MAG: Type 1 glutamine amidotransferase-like domain-containing protein [Acidobacteriota bacterium]
MQNLTLLGPQRLQPTLVSAFDRLGISGRVAAITAGWQEREAEVEEMREHLGRPVVDLMLHQRCEQVFADEPELFRAHRQRQDQLRAMQQIYRYRLDFAIQPARELLNREGDAKILEPERESAIAALMRLDEEHLVRIAEVHRAFERRLASQRFPALEAQRAKIAEILEGSSALAIAGGHVAVLLNRMRLCGLAELAAELPIVAWSAGAMALAHRIVLFHDSPPQGAGSAEVLDLGLGLFDDLQPLPHARRRLRLNDPGRVELFARRFAPALCLALDEGAAITREDGRWRPISGLRRLSTDGRVERLEAAA